MINENRAIKIQAGYQFQRHEESDVVLPEGSETLYTLDPKRAALVIIDMQNFSCRPSSGAPLPNIQEVINRINRLVDFCHLINIPVIWVRQNFSMKDSVTDAGLFPLFHDAHQIKTLCNKGYETEIYPEMHFNPSIDHVVFKNRYSAFLSDPPELRQKLEFLSGNQLIVAGIAANVCVESTVRDAMQLDYEVVLVSDGTTAPDEHYLETTLKNIRSFFGDVMPAEKIMDALK